MDVSIDRDPDSALTLAVPQPDTKKSKPGNDINLMLEKPSKPKPKPFPLQPRRVAPPPAPPAPRPPQVPPPPVPNMHSMDTFEAFANPHKLKPPPQVPEEDHYSDGESEDGSGGSDDSQGGGGGDRVSEYSVDEPPEPEDEPDYLRPSPGFSTLDEEKASLIFKLARAKRAGMPSSRTFNISSDIRDMRGEMARIDHELALDSSLKFQRKMLMMTVSVMEHCNTRYDPFDLQLDGWSESVHSSVSDYDRVFERLHEKYKSKVSVAPEIELLLMLGGSAMMFHFTKTVFKQGLPGVSANPDMLQSMLKAVAQARAPQVKPVATQEPPAPKPNTKPGQRREMRGPQMDLGGIMGGFGGGGAMPFPPIEPPQIANAEKKGNKPQKSVTFAQGTKRPAPREEEEEEEERLSDIVSDMGSVSIESLPDNLSSFGSESTEDGAVRTVQMRAGKGRAKRSKTVITL